MTDTPRSIQDKRVVALQQTELHTELREQYERDSGFQRLQAASRAIDMAWTEHTHNDTVWEKNAGGGTVAQSLVSVTYTALPTETGTMRFSTEIPKARYWLFDHFELHYDNATARKFTVTVKDILGNRTFKTLASDVDLSTFLSLILDRSDIETRVYGNSLGFDANIGIVVEADTTIADSSVVTLRMFYRELVGQLWAIPAVA